MLATLLFRLKTTEAERNLALASSANSRAEEAERGKNAARDSLHPFGDGVALAAAGHHVKAVQAYRKAVEIDDSNSEAWYGMGISLEALGRNDEAINAYGSALRINPKSIGSLMRLAAIHRRASDWQQAAGLYQRLIEVDGKEPQWLHLKAMMLDRMGECKEVAALLEQYCTASPDDLQGLNNLAWFYLTAPDTAIRNASRALELINRAKRDPARWNPKWENTLALALVMNGYVDDALSAVSRSLQRRGDNAVDLLVLAIYKAAKGDHESANEKLKSSERLGASLTGRAGVDVARLRAVAEVFIKDAMEKRKMAD